MISKVKNFSVKLLMIVSSFSVLTALLASPNAEAATCTKGLYGYGSQGICVQYIQSMIDSEAAVLHWEYFTSLTVDGQFGPLTKAQVEIFQLYTNNTPDGIVGPITLSALCQKAFYVYTYTPPTRNTQFLEANAKAAGCVN